MSGDTGAARLRSGQAEKIACKVYNFGAAVAASPAVSFAALINSVLYCCWVPGVSGR